VNGSHAPWIGKLVGVIAGFLLVRADPPFGALIGLLLGHAFDAGWFGRREREDPYRVLGLTEDASDAQVDLARRRLLGQFHPDRVSEGEPRRVAEQRTRAINAAYDRIRVLRQSSRSHR
jgi:DnaJ-domain-containing protein 1